MQFWFVHSGEVSLREQICTQVYLGISSGALRPGQALPSTRAMARRYGLHPNTVSAAYQQMQADGMLERRHGAGVFVRGTGLAAATGEEDHRRLDRLIAGFLATARSQGFTREQLTERVRRWMEVRPPDHFLVVEPEDERREIVLAELGSALRLSVRGCATAECGEAAGCIAVALPSKMAQARAALPAHVELIELRVTSVPEELRTWLGVGDEGLIGLVSRWPEFVRIARTMLVAAGFAPERLVERRRGEAGWRLALEQTVAVVCDAASAPLLPARVRAIVFPLVSESTLELLRVREAEISSQLDEAAEAT